MNLEDKEIKIVMKRNVFKWAVTIFFLFCNFCYIGAEESGESDRVFMIVFGITINGLAVLSFVLFSVLSRDYCIFNENGISYRTRKGKIKREILWDEIVFFGYLYFLCFPLNVEIRYLRNGEKKQDVLEITNKQYENIIKTFALKEKQIKFY